MKLPYIACLVLLLTLGTAAEPHLPLQRGSFRNSSYAAVAVDPARMEVLVYGRRPNGWTGPFCALESLPGDCLAALNGTFFSLRWHQPAGVLLYDRGRRSWTPTFKRFYGSKEVHVSSLSRWYLALLADGGALLGDSRGQSAETVRARYHPAPRALLGGGGLLVQGGKRVICGATLAAEGFDEHSGLQPSAALPRTGVGLDGQGRVLLVTAGLPEEKGGTGLALGDFADLLLMLGARDAIFLDCGSSTAMRVGQWQRSAGRALPTWLVVRKK